MKFDDLIKQVYNRNQDKEENTKNALDILEKKFKQPLSSYKFQPHAYVCFEAIHKDKGNHQEQVRELIKQTAASINNLALKMLFVTVQQNNLEICIEYAVNQSTFRLTDTMVELVDGAASWFRHCYLEVQKDNDYGKKDYMADWDGYTEGGYHWYGGRYGRYGGGYGGQTQFRVDVQDIVTSYFKKPSLHAFIAILICLEHSFWLTQQGSHPTKAFTEALGIYLKNKHAVLDPILDDYLTLKASNDWFTTKHQPSVDEVIGFRQIVLNNLLPHPKPSI